MNLKGKAVFIYAITATVVAVALIVVLLVTHTDREENEKTVSVEIVTEPTAESSAGGVTEPDAETVSEAVSEAVSRAADENGTEMAGETETKEASEIPENITESESYSALSETLKRASESKELSGKTVPKEAFEALGIMQGAVIDGWSNMLDKLRLDADIVFFGDSLTKGSDFQADFQDLTIVNLGVGGDTIDDLTHRVSMVGTVNPEKVFLLCGINSLRDGNAEECFWKYMELLDRLQETVPNAVIYIQSILPLSEEMQKGLPCSNGTVKEFNEGIRWLASDRGITYIDLYPLYEQDGVMNPEYSSDGIHPIAGLGYRPWAEAVYPYIYE